jgi:hypothetical protein
MKESDLAKKVSDSWINGQHKQAIEQLMESREPEEIIRIIADKYPQRGYNNDTERSQHALQISLMLVKEMNMLWSGTLK